MINFIMQTDTLIEWHVHCGPYILRIVYQSTRELAQEFLHFLLANKYRKKPKNDCLLKFRVHEPLLIMWVLCRSN